MFFESRENYKLELSDDLNGSQNGQFHFCATLGHKRAQKGEGSMIVQMQHQGQYYSGRYDDAAILILTAAATGNNTLLGAWS